jgi:hypothetical protein
MSFRVNAVPVWNRPYTENRMRLLLVFFLTLPLSVGAEEPPASPNAAPSGTKTEVIRVRQVTGTGTSVESAPPGQSAGAAQSAGAGQSAGAEGKEWYSLSEGKLIGLGIGAGFPDGGGLTFLFRPWWWLRLNGGLAYNYLGYGVRGGVSLQPVSFVVTPVLTLDMGRYLTGDITKIVSTSNASARHVLQNMTYSFASAQVGLEIGSQESVAFFLRGGLVHVFGMSASGADVTNYVNSSQTKGKFNLGDLNVTATLPCFSLGFIIFLY